ncbi:MAG: non-heme iron oxygenase ferredoxin subunit [Chloroflexia bacterium]|nr:non-heme iron oxygenase ferredoxin subunit [Chloroflexia bacterium]
MLENTLADDLTWHVVAKTSDLAPGEVMYVEVGNDPVALINLEGEFFALHDLCTHQDASLSDGEVIGDEIECPMHGGVFEIRTGLPANFPVVVPVETYAVKTEGDAVLVAKRRAS